MTDSKSGDHMENDTRVVVQPLKNPCQKVADLVNRKLTLSDLDNMPTNLDFACPVAKPFVDKTIRNNKDIIFHSVKMWTAQWDTPGVWGFKFRFLWNVRGEDGRVMLLIIDDIFPNFFIRCPDGMTKEQFAAAAKKDLNQWKQPREMEIVFGKRLVYYDLDEVPYARVFFNNTADFDKAKDHFKEVLQWKVAEVKYTKTRFYLQACRQNMFNSASINKFKFLRRGNPYPKNIVSDIDEVFVVSAFDIEPINIEDIENPRESMVVPRLYNMNFDIETGSAERGQALHPEREDTHCNVISLTQRYNGEDQFRVSLTTSPHAEPREGFCLFICNNEIEMFLIMANIIRKLRPAIVSTYNGDVFDWNFVVTKLIRHECVCINSSQRWICLL